MMLMKFVKKKHYLLINSCPGQGIKLYSNGVLLNNQKHFFTPDPRKNDYKWFFSILFKENNYLQFFYQFRSFCQFIFS